MPYYGPHYRDGSRTVNLPEYSSVIVCSNLKPKKSAQCLLANFAQNFEISNQFENISNCWFKTTKESQNKNFYLSGKKIPHSHVCLYLFSGCSPSFSTEMSLPRLWTWLPSLSTGRTKQNNNKPNIFSIFQFPTFSVIQQPSYRYFSD